MFSYLLLSILGCFIQLIMIRTTDMNGGIWVRLGGKHAKEILRVLFLK